VFPLFSDGSAKNIPRLVSYCNAYAFRKRLLTPFTVTHVAEDKAQNIIDADGNEFLLPVDITTPNPNGFEMDNLYLDMNGIVRFKPTILRIPGLFQSLGTPMYSPRGKTCSNHRTGNDARNIHLYGAHSQHDKTSQVTLHGYW
jgi:hypothetical protein